MKFWLQLQIIWRVIYIIIYFITYLITYKLVAFKFYVVSGHNDNTVGHYESNVFQNIIIVLCSAFEICYCFRALYK